MKRKSLVFMAPFIVSFLCSAHTMAYTFTPANSNETDSAFLISDYSVLIDGVAVNNNHDFSAGELTDAFWNAGDVTVIDSIGAIGSVDDGQYFALGTTLIPNGDGMDWTDLMTYFDLTEVSVDSTIELQITYAILTNEENPSFSPDYFTWHCYPNEDETDMIDLFTTSIAALTYVYSPEGTGFKWITAEPVTLKIDLTNALENSSGVQIHLGIGEPSMAPVPEPSTMLLLGTGLVAIVGAARRRLKK